MHDLNTIIRNNAKAQPRPIQSKVLSNRGDVFPILNVQVGDRFESWAPFHPDCRFTAGNSEQQVTNSRRLHSLMRLCDAAYASLVDSNGFTVYDASAEDEDDIVYDPDSGYMVSMEGNEEIVPGDCSYGRIYKYLFDHRGQLGAGFCIGGWVYEACTYLDVSLWFADRDEAVAHAVCNNQLAIWDCSNGREILLDSPRS